MATANWSVEHSLFVNQLKIELIFERFSCYLIGILTLFAIGLDNLLPWTALCFLIFYGVYMPYLHSL